MKFLLYVRVCNIVCSFEDTQYTFQDLSASIDSTNGIVHIALSLSTKCIHSTFRLLSNYDILELSVTFPYDKELFDIPVILVHSSLIY